MSNVSQDELQKVKLRPLDVFEGTLSNRVYLSLRDAILTLEYGPGQILRKQPVCEVLNVSRSPVSEAITRLASDGLVLVRPQTGTFVARFSMEEIRESAFLREAFELAAIEHLAPTITDTQIALLEENLTAQEALVKVGDFAGFYDMDSQMHGLLMGFTGFKRLERMADSVWLQVSRARRLILPEPGRIDETLREHRAIIDALATHDSEAARLATRTHLRQLLSYLEPLEERRPDLFSAS
ncbi:MAG: GntR family transcriptional regulator [Rhodobacteraceae bacterium]|nr:GntR family transcriptional regulator [Paracoccaceae bacterium]